MAMAMAMAIQSPEYIIKREANLSLDKLRLPKDGGADDNGKYQ